MAFPGEREKKQKDLVSKVKAIGHNLQILCFYLFKLDFIGQWRSRVWSITSVTNSEIMTLEHRGQIRNSVSRVVCVIGPMCFASSLKEIALGK